MKAYEIDEGCAIYWVFADNIGQAVALYWDQAEVQEDPPDFFSVEEMARGRCERLKIRMDLDGNRSKLSTLLDSATQPYVVGCTEWQE